MGKPAVFASAKGEQLIKTKYSEWLRHWPVAKEELYLDTRHGKTFVIASGEPGKPPLVLLHGAGANNIMWLPDIETYARNHRVYAVDIIGEPNFSDPHRPKLKGPAYTEWLEDVLAALQVKETAMVGISLGGWMALQFACAHPERITHLALLCPAGIVGPRKRFLLQMLLAMVLLGRWGRRLMFRRLLGKDHLDPRVKDYLRLVFEYFNPRRTGISKLKDQTLAQLYCPTLLILGGRDKIFSPEKTLLRLAKNVPQLEVIYRRKSGHFLSEFTREIDRFLATLHAPD